MLRQFLKPVSVGDKVLVVVNQEAKELEIVDLPQGDLRQGKISWLSPIAQAVLGKRQPQTVTVRLANGKTIDCRLLKVAR